MSAANLHQQLIQIYICSCQSPSTLKEFVVQIPGAESVKVSLESERWVFDRGQRCLPVYIHFTDQLNVVAIELWSNSSNVPVSVFPLELSDLQIGKSVSHSLKWIDNGAIKHCNVVIAKAQIFTPSRFANATAYNKPNIDPDFQLFVSRCTYNSSVQPGRSVVIVSNANGYRGTKSLSRVWSRNQIWNESISLERLNPQSGATSSLDLAIIDADSDSPQTLARFQPIPLNGHFATRGHFSVPNVNDSIEATLFLSISPVVDSAYESALLDANPIWEKVQISFHSIQLPDIDIDTVFITAFLSVNIEQYQKKVDDSLMLWPPFPVSKLVKAGDQTESISLCGEDSSYRFYLSGPIKRLSFPTLSLDTSIFDDKQIVFSQGCFIVAEIYSYPKVAELSPYLLGYCSMKLSDRSLVSTSTVYGCGGTLTWSVCRPNKSRFANEGEISWSSVKNEATTGMRKSEVILQKAHRILHLTRVPALRLNRSNDQESKLKGLLEEAQQELIITRKDCKRLESELEDKAAALNACIEKARELERQCEQLNNDKWLLENRLNEYVQLQEKFLQNTGIEGSPLNVAQLQTLLKQSRHDIDTLKSENDDKQRLIESLKSRIHKTSKLEKTLATIKEAHAAQTNYLQSIQDDRKKIEKFYKTIQYQEDIIVNLEGLLRSCQTVPVGPSVGSELSAQGDNWKERALKAEARCNAFEGELRIAAEHYGKEIASLQTQLMEANIRPKSADSTLSVNVEDFDELEREQ